MSERIEEIREGWETFKEQVNSLIVLQSVRGGQTESIADAGTKHEADFLNLLERLDELERENERLRDAALERAEERDYLG